MRPATPVRPLTRSGPSFLGDKSGVAPPSRESEILLYRRDHAALGRVASGGRSLRFEGARGPKPPGTAPFSPSRSAYAVGFLRGDMQAIEAFATAFGCVFACVTEGTSGPAAAVAEAAAAACRRHDLSQPVL